MQIPFISGISATAWTTLGSTIVVYLVNPIIVWIVVGLFIWLMFRIRSFFGYRSDEYRDARLRRDMERSLDRTLSDGALRNREIRFSRKFSNRNSGILLLSPNSTHFNTKSAYFNILPLVGKKF